MKTSVTLYSIIKGKNNSYYIGKKILNSDSKEIGTVLDASVNKHYNRVYMDIDIDDIYNNPKTILGIKFLKTETKRYKLFLTETKVSIKRKKSPKL